jgi:tripartite-type tricarboxylate transporter receptor subunit TctC
MGGYEMQRRTFLVGASALPFTMPALARENFPSRAVSMVVAFPPGGQAIVVGRAVAATLERIWGVPVTITGVGEFGNSFVARSAPDGHTLLMGLYSMAFLPEAARINGRTPAYTPDMLTPITLFSADPTVLVVPAVSPIRTIEEFIAEVRAKPGQIAYSSAGNYSASHLPMAMLSQAARLQLLHVPFQSGAAAMTAILRGQVQALAWPGPFLLSPGPGSVAPQVPDGRLRALATWERQRLKGFEDVPTFVEKGFADLEFYIWVGLFAPAGTPPAIIDRIRGASRQVAQDAEFQHFLAASGNTLDFRDGDAFRRFFDEDSARLLRVIRALGKIE